MTDSTVYRVQPVGDLWRIELAGDSLAEYERSKDAAIVRAKTLASERRRRARSERDDRAGVRARHAAVLSLPSALDRASREHAVRGRFLAAWHQCAEVRSWAGSRRAGRRLLRA